MWGINFMRCSRKFPTCISNDVSNNDISCYPICFSLGGIKEQLNRLTTWPSSFKQQKCEFLTVYCMTLPQKEKNSLFKETVMLISLRGMNNFFVSTSAGSFWFKTIIWTQIRTNVTLIYWVLIIQILTGPESDIWFGLEYNTNSSDKYGDKHCIQTHSA